MKKELWLRLQHYHHPELMPLDEQTGVFRAQYDATLALYVAEFNRSPPVDIWGTPKFQVGASMPIRPAAPLKTRGGTPPSGDDTPLYLLVGASDGNDGPSNGGSVFGGGGGFSGGGGGSTWGDHSMSDSAQGGDVSDSGSSVNGGSGDGGSGDGGSGCSSGCCGGGE